MPASVEMYLENVESYKLTIRIYGDLPKAMNKVMRSNRWKNHADASKWKKIIGQKAMLFRPEVPLKSFKVKATRHSYRMLDYDGLVASLKPCIDALKDVVIADDRWACTGPWAVNQEFRSKKQGGLLEIIISGG